MLTSSFGEHTRDDSAAITYHDFVTDSPKILTAEEFADERLDLPEGGRWHELESGIVVMLQPPESGHGTAVLNFSRALSEWLRDDDGSENGYACFDIGLIVERDPDTVRSPAVSYFAGGRRFEESDKLVTETCPRLVIELASTNDRRRGIRDRVLAYHERGVEAVWVADPIEKTVTLLPRGRATRTVAGEGTLESDVLAGFTMTVEQFFAEPDWWTGEKKP